MILKTWTYTYLIIWIDQTCKCPWPPDHMQMYIYSDVSLSLSYEYQDICLMWQICSTLHMQYSICDFSMNHWWFFKVCLLEAISTDQVHLPRYLLGFKNMLWKKLVLCIYIYGFVILAWFRQMVQEWLFGIYIRFRHHDANLLSVLSLFRVYIYTVL